MPKLRKFHNNHWKNIYLYWKFVLKSVFFSAKSAFSDDFVLFFTFFFRKMAVRPLDKLNYYWMEIKTSISPRSSFSSCIVVGKDGSKVTTVVATPGQGSDRPQEVSYTDTKVIGNGSFGVVYQAKLCETNELVAIKKVLQDKRFKVSSLLFNMAQQTVDLRRQLPLP